MACCWAWQGLLLLSSLPQPHGSLPHSEGTTGATGLLLGCSLGIRKEQQPCQGSTAHCRCVLSLKQQLPIIPRIMGCSELAGTQGLHQDHGVPLWNRCPFRTSPTGQAFRAPCSPQPWEAAPQPTGTQDGPCRKGAAQGSLEELWDKHTPSRSTPRTAPPQGAHSGSPVPRAFLMECVDAALIDNLTQHILITVATI